MLKKSSQAKITEHYYGNASNSLINSYTITHADQNSNLEHVYLQSIDKRYFRGLLVFYWSIGFIVVQ